MNCCRCNIYIKKNERINDEWALHFKKKKYNLCGRCREDFQYGLVHFLNSKVIESNSKEEKLESLLATVDYPISQKDMCRILRWTAQNSDNHKPLCDPYTEQYDQMTNFHHQCTKCYTARNWPLP